MVEVAIRRQRSEYLTRAPSVSRAAILRRAGLDGPSSVARSVVGGAWAAGAGCHTPIAAKHRGTALPRHRASWRRPRRGLPGRCLPAAPAPVAAAHMIVVRPPAAVRSRRAIPRPNEIEQRPAERTGGVSREGLTTRPPSQDTACTTCPARVLRALRTARAAARPSGEGGCDRLPDVRTPRPPCLVRTGLRSAEHPCCRYLAGRSCLESIDCLGDLTFPGRVSNPTALPRGENVSHHLTKG